MEIIQEDALYTLRSLFAQGIPAVLVVPVRKGYAISQFLGNGLPLRNRITISPPGGFVRCGGYAHPGEEAISTLRVDDICGVAADDILPLVGLDAATSPKNGLTIKIESVE